MAFMLAPRRAATMFGDKAVALYDDLPWHQAWWEAFGAKGLSPSNPEARKFVENVRG